MSTLSSILFTNSKNEEDEAARFVTTQDNEEFTFSGVMTKGKEYTIHCLLRSNASTLLINGTSVELTEQWSEYQETFTADSSDLILDFPTAGTYDIYHLQLEPGNVATEWTISLEDINEAINIAIDGSNRANSDAANALGMIVETEARIAKLEDSIAMMVQDENGNSLMQQTGSGWIFSTKTIAEQLKEIAQDTANTEAGKVQSNLDILRGEVAAQDVTDYLIIGKDSNNKTTLELGATDGSSRLALTNDRIQFSKPGDYTPAYITSDKLYIEEAEVTNELRFGNFVWKKRANGNMGIMWVGGGS